MRKLIFSLILIVAACCQIRLNAQIYGETIVSWDFSSGIPQDWIVGINSTTDLAQWEYRGPNTTPNINTGARGSCAAIAAPISSITRENGFVIFDGNYWDDPGNACGAGLGTGTDPAPHTAWLTTNAIDLTDVSSAVLTFQQQYRNFQATTKVQISTDGGATWTDILANTGVQSPNSEWKSVNISPLAANQASVQFKFIYQGTYYWWLLDDIAVYIPNENDLLLNDVAYTANPNINGLPSILNIEYNQYPTLLTPNLNFSAELLNVGSQIQTGVALNTRVVKDELTEVYNNVSVSQTVNPSESAVLNIPTSFVPNTGVGHYDVYFQLLQDSTDQSPESNIDSLDFEITPFTYAKDEGPMEDSFIPDNFYGQFLGAYGNFFNNPATNRYCHSIQVGVAEGTSVGKQIRGVVYDQDYDSLIAVTPVYEVNYADLNEVGEERMMYLDFDQPFQMKGDSTYLVLVQEIDSVQPFLLARSGKSYGESSLVRYVNINATLISSKSFQVRLSLFPQNASPGCTDATAMNFESLASVDDGSCRYAGCTNEDADNFNPLANFDNGTCEVGGCLDTAAANYNPFATYSNGNCSFLGCTAANALNFDPGANTDDGSCAFLFTAIEAFDISGCPPLTFHIRNNNTYPSISGCSYSINGTAISTSCDTLFEYTLSEPGTYALNYTISVGSTEADTTITIEVLPEPDAPELLYNSITQEIECANCSNVSYEWSFNGTSLPNEDGNSIAVTVFEQIQNGLYTLAIVNNAGCGGSVASVEILEPTLLGNLSSGCSPLAISFTNATDTVSGMVCMLESGVSTIENFSNSAEVVFETPGSYQAILTCSGQSITNTDTLVIDVFAPFTPTLIIDEVNGVVSCTNCDTAENISWNIDGVITNGGTSQPLGGDIYQIQASNAGGCGGSTMLIVNLIPENDAMGDLAIYPNPCFDRCTISAQEAFNLCVIDLNGKVVYSNQSSQSVHTLQTEQWAAGTYTLVLMNGDNKTARTLIVRPN
jgi:hypothetical protein